MKSVILHEDTIDLYSANYDHPGSSVFDGDLEKILFHQQSYIRIWYNVVTDSYPMHWHPSIEIAVPVENTYEYITPEKTYTLNPGDIFIMPSGSLHGCKAPDSGCRFIHLFDISFLQKLHGFGKVQNLLSEPMYITRLTHPAIYDEAQNLLANIRKNYFNQTNYHELLVAADLLKLFVLIGENSQNVSEVFPDTNPQMQKRYIAEFNSVLSYIDTHYTEDLTLENTAARSGFSKYHFSRLFKQYTGYTFCNYVNFRRLKVCEDLLADPDLSITEVAMQSGFPSISTFNRLFLEAKGCSPSEFRAKSWDERRWKPQKQ